MASDGGGHGYIKISRKAYREDPYWNKKRKFSEWEAWEDLIQLAAWSDREQLVGTERIALGRGEFFASIRFLAQRWQWSTSRVHRYLKSGTETERLAEHQENTHGSVYSIVNYDTYQDRPGDGGTATEREKNGNGTNTSKEKNRSKKKEGLPPVPEALSSPESLALWDEFCAWRKRELRKKVSPTAARKIFKSFEGYTPEDFASALEKSMTQDWQGVFPPKTPSLGSGREKPKRSHDAICSLINTAINRRIGTIGDEELRVLSDRREAIVDSRDTAAAEAMLRELEGE